MVLYVTQQPFIHIQSLFIKFSDLARLNFIAVAPELPSPRLQTLAFNLIAVKSEL